MQTPRYHIHVDGAHVPAAFVESALIPHGLVGDQFDHVFQIEGEIYPGSHFTRYLFEGELNAEEVRTECRAIAVLAEELAFKGLIQCEFIIEEHSWVGATPSGAINPPFWVTRRALSSSRGERFKKHELHLEIKKTESARGLISALVDTGLDITQSPRDITFTASGNPKELLPLKRHLKEFLDRHSQCFEGKLTYEATAFWSLHGLGPESLPKIVDHVEYYRSL